MEEAGQHHLVSGPLGPGQGRGLEGVVEQRDPLAVGLVGGCSQQGQHRLDQGFLAAEERQALPARIRGHPAEVGHGGGDVEGPGQGPPGCRRHPAGRPDDHEGVQDLGNGIGVAGADTPVIGGHQHRCRRADGLQQTTELGIGPGGRGPVGRTVPAVFVAVDVGPGQVHHGQVVVALIDGGQGGVDRAPIVLGVVAAVDRIPQFGRVRLDHRVEGSPVQEQSGRPPGPPRHPEEGRGFRLDRERGVVDQAVVGRCHPPEHRGVDGQGQRRGHGPGPEARATGAGQGGQVRHGGPGDVAGGQPVDGHHQHRLGRMFAR